GEHAVSGHWFRWPRIASCQKHRGSGRLRGRQRKESGGRSRRYPKLLRVLLFRRGMCGGRRLRELGAFGAILLALRGTAARLDRGARFFSIDLRHESLRAHLTSYFFACRVSRSASTSSLCVAGFAFRYTLRITPFGSMRNVLRDAYAVPSCIITEP